jgi:hypothetical protein
MRTALVCQSTLSGLFAECLSYAQDDVCRPVMGVWSGMLGAVNASRLHFGYVRKVTLEAHSTGVGEDSAKLLGGTEQGALDGFLGGVEDLADSAQAQALIML